MRKRNGAEPQLSLFATLNGNPPIRQAIEFYNHRHNWTNRLIAGDSLLVMNSLLEKEGLGGQGQTIYIDPPYGIRYGSNFQPFVNRRDVTKRQGRRPHPGTRDDPRFPGYLGTRRAAAWVSGIGNGARNGGTRLAARGGAWQRAVDIGPSISCPEV